MFVYNLPPKSIAADQCLIDNASKFRSEDLPALVDDDEEAECVDELLVVGEDVDGVADPPPTLAHLLPQVRQHRHLGDHS